MKTITCILVDDEKSARDVMTNILNSYFEEIEILDQCKNVLEAVESVRLNKPDVVFLDVQMPNYAGYEMVNFFKHIDFEIIFVTAYDRYAIKAFELSAIDYLVKPVNRLRLEESIIKLKSKLENYNKIEDYKNLLNSLQKKDFDTIILPELGNKRMVKLSEITAVEANGSYSIFHFNTGEKLTISKTLLYFKKLLPPENLFFRSHRGWIINLNSIISYEKSIYELTHKSGLKTKVARRKTEEFEAIFNQ